MSINNLTPTREIVERLRVPLDALPQLQNYRGEIIAYCDGGCRPSNPGRGVAGIVLQGEAGLWLQHSVYLGENITNNQAELAAVLLALKWVSAMPEGRFLTIKLDSQVTCKLIETGRAKLAHLRELLREVKKPEQLAAWDVVWHPREENYLADEMVDYLYRLGLPEWHNLMAPSR